MNTPNDDIDTLPPSDGEPFDTLPPDDEDDTIPGIARTPTVPQSFRAAPIPSDVLLNVPCDPTRPGEYHMRGFEEENVGRSTFKAAPRFIPHYPAMGHNCRCDDCRAER